MPHKILFLDYDGVLNGLMDYKVDNLYPLNPGSCGLLREILDTTGAKVCVSSVWRKDDSQTTGWCKLIHMGYLTKEHFDLTCAVTPDMTSRTRGEEIQWVIDLLTEVHGALQYAIVDDDDDMLPHQMPFFVRTNVACGMQRSAAEELIKLLT